MRRLDFDLEGKLVDNESQKKVEAKAIPVPPALVSFYTGEIIGPSSFDEEFIRRLDLTVNNDPYIRNLPFETDAYVASIESEPSREKGYVWVAIQCYKIN